MNSKLGYVFALVLGCVWAFSGFAEEVTVEPESAPTASPEAAPTASPKAAPKTSPPAEIPKAVAEEPRVSKKKVLSDIARAQFTTGIKDKEPVDELTVLQAGVDKIYFFVEARNLGGQSIIHRWVFAGKPVSEVKINIGGNRWRMWSSKELRHQTPGQWTVELVSASGEILMTKSLNETPKASSRNEVLDAKNVPNTSTPSSFEIQPNQEMQPSLEMQTSPESTPATENN